MIRRLLLVALFVLPLRELAAQSGVSIEITLPEARYLGRDAPAVASSNLLNGTDDEDLIRKGFPARLHYVAELWPTGGLFRRSVDRAEWDYIVRFEPLDSLYQVVRLASDGAAALGTFRSFSAVQAVVQRPYRPLMRGPQRTGRFYYSVTLEVERMAASDLDEVMRWMNGDVRQAVRGERSAGGAVLRTVSGVITRLLGAKTRRYETRSEVFEMR